MAVIDLPQQRRASRRYALTRRPGAAARAAAPPTSRASPTRAAHVVADPLADNDPWLDAAIDWDATLAFRHHLWDLGLGVAEAMDTAQRGMGLDWPRRRS